jgi:hypothetical protein
VLSGAALTVGILAYLVVGLFAAMAIEGLEGSRGYRSRLRTVVGRAFAVGALVLWLVYVVAGIATVGFVAFRGRGHFDG